MLKKFKVILIGLILFLPLIADADSLGQGFNFFVDSSYQIDGHAEITATLQKITPNAYFYTEDDWWRSLDYISKNSIEKALTSLANEFESKIYPVLTETFGSEWKPGIDKDERITILIHSMEEGAGGYFNAGDEYPRLQAPNSNEREMVYLNARYINMPRAKSLLAHEFTHLIVFAQKEKKYGMPEEIWLNEGRAEYAPTLLGYDDQYQGSNLQQRAEDFISNPGDSLTEWKNEKADYGALNLFIQYLVDHYGREILVDSLHSSKVGIPSLNYALKKNGFEEDFSQIFTDWTIAVLVNDCEVGAKYCYLNEDLKNIRVTPLINFLPLVGKATLNYGNATQNWSGNWLKIVGGKRILKFEFDGSKEVKFGVPYVIQDFKGNSEVKHLELDSDQNGMFYVSNFGTENISLVIIPSIQSKTSDFSDFEPYYSFFWSASTIEKTEEEKKAELIKELLARIEFLEKAIAGVKAEIEVILAERTKPVSCQKFEQDLSYGASNDERVRCLQEFLKAQGSEIYPQALVTGNFLELTREAVKRYQEKHAEEILKPLDLSEGTGYFGPLTRAVANKELK